VRARARLEARVFGKRILFTNRDWPVPDVVAAYRCQSDAECGFRQPKDPHVVWFSPMRHWTDSKIRVHVFYCVLALTIAHLMRRHADQAGLRMSVRELLDQLAGIEETVLLYHDGGKGRPHVQRVLTDMNPIQQRLPDPVHHPPIRTHPLNNSELGHTPALPETTAPPGQTSSTDNQGRKLPLGKREQSIAHCHLLLLGCPARLLTSPDSTGSANPMTSSSRRLETAQAGARSLLRRRHAAHFDCAMPAYPSSTSRSGASCARR